MMWDIKQFAEFLNKPYEVAEFIITDDREEFLQRMEGIAHRGLNKGGDTLKCLEILDEVKAVREGADIYETFPILKDWKERHKRG